MTHHDTSKAAREDLGLERVEAFSDAIFGFAATLLALAIAVPSAEEASSSRSLLRALQAALPSFVTFAVTFVVLGEAWGQPPPHAPHVSSGRPRTGLAQPAPAARC